MPVIGLPPGDNCIVKGPTPAVGLIVAVPLAAVKQEAAVEENTSPVTPGPTSTVTGMADWVVQFVATWVTTTL